jgi:hypothetical protein
MDLAVVPICWLTGKETNKAKVDARPDTSVSLNHQRLPVMHQPVDQGRGQRVVHVEQGAPIPEGSIRGKHDRSGFVTGRDHLEQQIGPALVDRQIAQPNDLPLADPASDVISGASTLVVRPGPQTHETEPRSGWLERQLRPRHRNPELRQRASFRTQRQG